MDRFRYRAGELYCEEVPVRQVARKTGTLVYVYSRETIEEHYRRLRRAFAGVDLQISGHTHGGQLWPLGGLVSLLQPYIAGLYRHSKDTQIYVSRGTGYWGPPMRLLAPAELTKIVPGPSWTRGRGLRA